MKAYKPNTDQRAEFNVFVNGQEIPLNEYEINFDREASNIIESFVPVVPGDEIMVKGTYEGTVLHGSFDLVCDGSLVADSRLEGKENKARFRKRSFEFRKVLHNARTPDWKSETHPTDCAEGRLIVKTLNDETIRDIPAYETCLRDAAMPGVGSIEVVVSVNQDTRDNYFNKEWSAAIGDWRHRGITAVRESGIAPDHELGIKITDPRVSRKRALKFKRHWEGTRFGSEPWARFIFYYRDIDAILNAGALPMEGEKLLDAGDIATLDSRFGTYTESDKQRQAPLEEADEEEDVLSNTDSPFLAQWPDSQKSSRASISKAAQPIVDPRQPREAAQRAEVTGEPQNQYKKRLGGTSHLKKDSPSLVESKMNRLGGTLTLDKNRQSSITAEFNANGGRSRSSTPLIRSMNDYEAAAEAGEHRKAMAKLEGNSQFRKPGQYAIANIVDACETAVQADRNLNCQDASSAFSHEDFVVDGGSDGDVDDLWEPVMPEDALGEDIEQMVMTEGDRHDSASLQVLYSPLTPPHGVSTLHNDPLHSAARRDTNLVSPLYPPTNSSKNPQALGVPRYSPSTAAPATISHIADESAAVISAVAPWTYDDVTIKEEQIPSPDARAQDNALLVDAPSQDTEGLAPQPLELPTTSNIATDFERLPSLEDIRRAIGVEGIDRWDLHGVFDRGAPYQNTREAQAEFDKRVAQVAVEDTCDLRHYVKEDYAARQSQLKETQLAENTVSESVTSACSMPSEESTEPAQAKGKGIRNQQPNSPSAGTAEEDMISANTFELSTFSGSGTFSNPRKRPAGSMLSSTSTSTEPPARRIHPTPQEEMGFSSSAAVVSDSPARYRRAADHQSTEVADLQRILAEKQQLAAEQEAQAAALRSRIVELEDHKRRAKEEEQRRIADMMRLIEETDREYERKAEEIRQMQMKLDEEHAEQ